MGFHSAVENKIEQLSGVTINGALLTVAVALVVIVFCVHNKWLKAAVLAWVVMP